jgi:hypothetical protein
LDRDTLACWIRSYSEAKQQQALLDTRQQQATARLFATFQSSITPAIESHTSLGLTDSDTSTDASDSSIFDIDDDSVLGSSFHLSDDTLSNNGGDGVPWDGIIGLDDTG